MELERDIRIVVITQLDNEKPIEPLLIKPHEYKIRLNKKLKTIPDLYSDKDDETSKYVDGFQMKCRFIKSDHMSSFTKEQDRVIEITEPTQTRPHILVHKHYPLNTFDLILASTRFENPSLKVNDWWKIYKTIIPTTFTDHHERQIELLCAPAFNLPLPSRLVNQTNSLIKFYEMFKTSLLSIYRKKTLSSSLLSSTSYILPAIQLLFRPKIFNWFDERIRSHERLKFLLDINCLCLVAHGSKNISFQYDFSLVEFHIVNQFNPREWELSNLIKHFALKHLKCPLDNYFLRTSLLWICEIHELENYHDVFEVWVSFMKDVCRKQHLPHYFLEDVNVYEEHSGFYQLLQTINYQNIDSIVSNLEENLIFPYIYQYNRRVRKLLAFFQSQPVLATKMKVIYNVLVKSQFTQVDCSLDEMCSVICHLSFLEDDEKDRLSNFWILQWKSLFSDFKRDDIVLRQPSFDYRPDQLAQQMTASVFKLLQMDFKQNFDSAKTTCCQ